ncbi:serine hydrolase domain-containing protein [Gemmatimonas sp.]|uniref:serine hydrolase domain-containing protein n=1 Tax=Gemmatimonas sp. TaxID=1962908 RepID=UPI00286E77D9|nr:serine hydrolase domain-containing protein [Gemmatimonas sp.]
MPRPRAAVLLRISKVVCGIGLGFITACAAADVTATPTAPPVEPPPVVVDPRTLAPYFPPTTGVSWDTIAGARLGYDVAALTAALDWAGTQRSTAVVVLWRGRIVAERYWSGWTPAKDSIIASASKSVLSAIAGELARSGRLALDSAATRYLGAGWSRSPGTESRITVRHLMGMMSGLNDSLQTVVQPGTRFYYNNPAYYQLFGVVQAASSESINALSRRVLFDRIGMVGSTWLPNVDTGELGWILSSTARDMARFGLLALNRGRWNGVPILADSAWFTASWRATPPDNGGYGLLWWLNGSSSYRIPGPYLLPTQPGALIPSAPSDLVAALGKGDKKIYVVPSLELVVVRHGEDADALGGNPLAVSTFDEQWWRKLKLAFRY